MKREKSLSEESKRERGREKGKRGFTSRAFDGHWGRRPEAGLTPRLGGGALSTAVEGGVCVCAGIWTATEQGSTRGKLARRRSRCSALGREENTAASSRRKAEVSASGLADHVHGDRREHDTE
ncbi:pollen-specific leucine-rich repeat extensin-like protein 4 [Iris pallida]|uniref:Pollen-specific leucine-rich repeat extensin-like protein 4 n=1 Tax=Iris pallida TaxID=29817 RepID=A0AAX6DWF0_IRIPA|nr:pollen-specific leucine-rich repeat extensin-like protein 4 [Iris pallida]